MATVDANTARLVFESFNDCKELLAAEFAKNARLRARNAALVDALEPFVACGNRLDPSLDEMTDTFADDGSYKQALIAPRVADLRKARAALEAARKDGEEG